MDTKDAGVRKAPVEGVDRVAKPTFLAHFLEQARGHASAKDHRQHLARIEVTHVIGAALEAKHDLRIHQVALLAVIATYISRRARLLAVCKRAECAELLLDLAHEGVMRDAAGCDHHHAIRAVLALDEIVELGRGEGLDRLRRSEDRAPQRLVQKRCLGEAVEDDIVGRIMCRADFLEDDMLLAFKLQRIELRIREDVRKDIDRQRDVFLQHPSVEGRGFDAGCGVDLASDVFDLRCDLPCASPAGALEGHVLEEMGKAVLVFALVARAGLDPNPEGDGFDVWKGFGCDCQAVRQTAYLNTHIDLTP